MQIADVTLVPLSSNRDDRGALTEVFRSVWLRDGGLVQWNFVESAANTVRGVHVHQKHDDYFVVLQGHADIWLRDLRADSGTCDVVERVQLTGVESGAILVPTGIAHGVASLSPTWLLTGESRYWCVDDELRCRWDDPDLGFEWGLHAPLLSAQDEEAGSFSELVTRYRSAAVGNAG